ELSDSVQLVADFSVAVPSRFVFFNTFAFSLSGVAEISPDGTQMALIMRPQNLDNSEIWVVDLTDGSIRWRLPTQSISWEGLTEWVEHDGFVPESLTWINDHEFVINFISPRYRASFGWLAYRINLETDDITSIFD